MLENIESKTEFLKQRIQKLPKWLTNKYFLVSAFFFVWMIFIADKDIFSSFSQHTKLKNLQKNEAILSKTIAETQKELDLLKNSAITIEKYAREKYLMKKDNEDLFIVKE